MQKVAVRYGVEFPVVDEDEELGVCVRLSVPRNTDLGHEATPVDVWWEPFQIDEVRVQQ